MNKLALIIDFQEEWRNKNSDYYLGDFSEKIANAKLLVEFCRAKNIPVIYTRHVTPGSTTAFVDGSSNIEIVQELAPTKHDKVIVKNKISPFYKTDLEKEITKHNATQIVIGGILTNLCVRSAVSDAYDRDLKIVLIKDACVSDSSEMDEFTFRDLKKTRPKIEILSTKEFLRTGS